MARGKKENIAAQQAAVARAAATKTVASTSII